MTAPSPDAALAEPWSTVPAVLRSNGLRWTPQRRLLIGVLAGLTGHVTGAELVERCRAIDPSTTPSTVYRTLDVLEAIGLVRHGHGADGREEYHVRPGGEHGHLYCAGCGGTEEISKDEAAAIAAVLRPRHGFLVDTSHITIVGRCGGCQPEEPPGEEGSAV